MKLVEHEESLFGKKKFNWGIAYLEIISPERENCFCIYFQTWYEIITFTDMKIDNGGWEAEGGELGAMH